MIIIRKDETFNQHLMNKLKAYYEKTKRTDKVTHVSDILPPPNCIRRAYYGRKFPEENTITLDSVNHFLRGQAYESAITKLAGAGVSQLDVEYGKTVKGHPDIAGENVIYELKDTTSLDRLSITDLPYKGYLRQLLYYMVMTNKDKGILTIKYNGPKLTLQRRLREGELYLKPYGSKAGIESWDIYLGMDDPIREELKQEILLREELFQEALRTSSPVNLPRLPQELEKKKCNYCPYKKRCFREDDESESAIKLREKEDLLEKNVDASDEPAPHII